MARIRTIKPEFWTHEGLSALPEPTHMLAAALLNQADDAGYFNANPALVNAQCFPLREPSVSVHDSLNLLAAAGFIRLGSGENGRRYGHIVKFLDHQRINRPTPSKIRELHIAWEDSVSPHTPLSEPSPQEGMGKEGTGKEGSAAPRTRGRAPTTPIPEDFAVSDQVRAWANSKGYDHVDKQFEVFASRVRQHGYAYADWDEALKAAVRDDWAKLRTPSSEPPVKQRVDL